MSTPSPAEEKARKAAEMIFKKLFLFTDNIPQKKYKAGVSDLAKDIYPFILTAIQEATERAAKVAEDHIKHTNMLAHFLQDCPIEIAQKIREQSGLTSEER